MIRSGWKAWLSLFALALMLLPLATPVQAEEITPARVAAAVDQLDTVVQDAMARTGVPGVAVAVVYRDEVVYLKGFGVRQVGTDLAVGPETVFQLASVSKPVASTVVAALVGDGVVTWDDHIADLDPGFKMYEPWATEQVTLRDMFSHRSGLHDHAGDLLEDLGFDRTTILARMRFMPPAYSLRNGYAYTNFGLTEAAVAAAGRTGKTWEALSKSRLYDPLGMHSTSSRFADFVSAEDHALTHVRVNGAWEAKYVREPDAQTPAGGVSSSVRDMAQWIRLQLGNGLVDGKQIVAAAPLAETHRPQVISVPPANPSTDKASLYGLGWNVGSDAAGRVRLSHSGAFALGAATNVTLLPSEQLGIVVLTNGEPIGVAEAVSSAFMDLATEGKVTRDWVGFLGQAFTAAFAPKYGQVYLGAPPADPAPAAPLGAYTGTYANDYFGGLRIEQTGGGLVMRLGPLNTPFALRHWDGDMFTYQPVGENAAGPSGVTFSLRPHGRAAQVVVEYLNVDGEGDVTGVGVFPRIGP